MNVLLSSTSSARPLYWLLQSIAWTLYGTIGFIINLRFNIGVPAFKIAGVAYSGAFLLFCFTHRLRGFALRNNWPNLGFVPLIIRLLLATFLLSLVSQLILSALIHWPFGIVSPERPYSIGYLILYIFQTQVILLLWSLGFFSYHAIRNYKNEEVERWKLEASIKGAELAALKAQINPHFIFNCLNNIRALVLEDPQIARTAITRLSDLLRASIQFNKSEKVSLRSELEIVRDYLALEQIHMEDRLRFDIVAQPDSEDCQIPPMAIQLLVENAIKHSLAQLPAGGLISISAEVDLSWLRIQVTNTGQLSQEKPDPSRSTHTGLANLLERLELLFGPHATLSLENSGPQTVSATLNIPVERPPQEPHEKSLSQQAGFA